MDGADVAFDELRSHVPALLVTIQARPLHTIQTLESPKRSVSLE
jgi:hypothetical protein